jgi:uncharacterized membrane protein
MGIDHVRDFVAPTAFWPEDISQTTPAWFFTRWITHFCAPVFVMLAGTSAFLYGAKKSKTELRNFLWSRGLWLVFAELILVHFGWTFNFDWWFLQVIWVLGVSLILLGIFIYLPRNILMAFTAITLLGHNLLDYVHFDNLFWYLLHEQKWDYQLGNIPLAIVYPLVPWIAVMTLGYLLGELFLLPEEPRNKKLLYFGTATTVAFIIIRLINMYGDPYTWASSGRGEFFTFMSFLNTNKYPPSLLFLMMTLGPGLIVLAKAEKWGSSIKNILSVFGRVPFFYYILHLYVGQLIGIVYMGLRFGVWGVIGFDSPEHWPENYRADLLAVYMCWLVLTVIMYFLCRWFGGVKQRSDAWWMKYL